MKRKIEILAVEKIRIRGAHGQMFCPVCQKFVDFLTTMQAAEIAGVRAESVRRWLVRGKAHGIKTVGGRHRVCRNSLFLFGRSEQPASAGWLMSAKVDQPADAGCSDKFSNYFDLCRRKMSR